jgi:hypothetical protein
MEQEEIIEISLKIKRKYRKLKVNSRALGCPYCGTKIVSGATYACGYSNGQYGTTPCIVAPLTSSEMGQL